MIGEILAILAGVLHSVAYLEYNRGVLSAKTKPNGTTWLIWSFIAVISTASYFRTTGDLWKNTIPVVNIFLCISTLAISIYFKRVNWPDKWDIVALAIGLGAIVVWQIFKSAQFANMIVQCAIIAGFEPTWRGLKRGKITERNSPWWIWTAGYTVAMIVVLVRWNNQWYDLVYPVNCIILHASVPLLNILNRRAKP